MAARQVIAEFNKKQLNFDTDSLNAVSDVLNVFEKSTRRFASVKGARVSRRFCRLCRQLLARKSLLVPHISGFHSTAGSVPVRPWMDLVLRVNDTHPTEYQSYLYHVHLNKTEEEIATSYALERLSCEEFVYRVHREELV